MDEPLSQYFNAGPYRLQMQFARGDFSSFFGKTSAHQSLVGERSHWLAHDTARYLAFRPEAEPLVREALNMAVASGTIARYSFTDLAETALHLGHSWEPDYLILSREGGAIRLVCGCVCFPSSWALEEKIGQPMALIHDVVPDLNATIGRQIESFLSKLKPGVCWLRSNWGLSRSAELNQHPARNLKRLDATVGADEVFFRVEEQALCALPESNGILFGIRLRVLPLRAFSGDPAAPFLRHALETMPEPMARYKGIASARERLLELMAGF